MEYPFWLASLRQRRLKREWERERWWVFKKQVSGRKFEWERLPEVAIENTETIKSFLSGDESKSNKTGHQYLRTPFFFPFSEAVHVQLVSGELVTEVNWPCKYLPFTYSAKSRCHKILRMPLAKKLIGVRAILTAAQWATKVMPLVLCVSYGSKCKDFFGPLYMQRKHNVFRFKTNGLPLLLHRYGSLRGWATVVWVQRTHQWIARRELSLSKDKIKEISFLNQDISFLMSTITDLYSTQALYNQIQIIPFFFVTAKRLVPILVRLHIQLISWFAQTKMIFK